MTDIIVGGILLVILAAAIAYIVKEKKSGTKCIGCPAGRNCSQQSKDGTCGCHMNFK